MPTTAGKLAMIGGWLTAILAAYPFMRGLMGAVRPEMSAQVEHPTDQQAG